MSDDDEYYDDDFDGEWIWFDEGERELADDLAGGTMHSPVYMDQPTYDGIDSASDWEYYTDEYFDDDLSLIRKQNLATVDQKGAGRRRKRAKVSKESPPREVADDDEKDNQGSFYPIIWRTSDFLADSGELYQPGNGEKVSLLKNWREIFKDSQPKKDHRLQKSASGHPLAKSNRKPGRPRKVHKQDPGIAVEIDSRMLKNYDLEDYEEGVTEPSLTPPPSSIPGSQQDVLERPKKTRSPRDHHGRPGSQLKSVMSAQELPESDTKTQAKASPMVESPNTLEDGYEADVADNIHNEENSRPRRKRKASSPLDNTEGDVDGGGLLNGKTRAKRAATRRKLDNEKKELPPALIGPARRSPRERKK